jgi:hypothetical protein
MLSKKIYIFEKVKAKQDVTKSYANLSKMV